MNTRPISEHVDVERFIAGGKDAHGNPRKTWGAAESVGVYAFDPGGTSEPALPGHDRTITIPTLYVPPDAVFGSRDRVTARGVKHEVEGETRAWVHPTLGPIGNVVTLKVVPG